MKTHYSANRTKLTIDHENKTFALNWKADFGVHFIPCRKFDIDYLINCMQVNGYKEISYES